MKKLIFLGLLFSAVLLFAEDSPLDLDLGQFSLARETGFDTAAFGSSVDHYLEAPNGELLSVGIDILNQTYRYDVVITNFNGYLFPVESRIRYPLQPKRTGFFLIDPWIDVFAALDYYAIPPESVRENKDLFFESPLYGSMDENQRQTFSKISELEFSKSYLDMGSVALNTLHGMSMPIGLLFTGLWVGDMVSRGEFSVGGLNAIMGITFLGMDLAALLLNNIRIGIVNNQLDTLYERLIP